MSKRLIKQIIIVIVVSSAALFTLLGFTVYRWLRDPGNEYFYDTIFGDNSIPEPNPNFLSDYPNNKTGSYEFDPHTIFASLDQGKEIFTIEKPGAAETEDDSITWTQSDFLRVANALSLITWHESLDDWNVYNVVLSGSCNDHFAGFDVFDITYYKTIKTDWEISYTARHIKLIPSLGVAQWGGDGDFSAPWLYPWRNIELAKFKITAEQAVQIADENGGKVARMNGNNKCDIDVGMNENRNRDFEDDWDIDYTIGYFGVFVNPFSGDVYQKH